MSGGGGGGDQTTTTKVEIPEYLKQPLIRSVEGVEGTNDTPQYFPGQQTVPFAPESALALNLKTQAALQGSPLTGAATANNLGTLGGNFFNAGAGTGALAGLASGPQFAPGSNQLLQTARGDFLPGGAADAGFQQQFQASANRLTPQVQSTFEKAGRTGSGLAQTAQQQALTDSFANLYGQERGRQLDATGQLGGQFNAGQQLQAGAAQSLNQAFDSERGRQIQAQQLAPQLAASRYADINALGQVGQSREALAQKAIQEQVARFGFMEDADRQRAIQQLAAITGASGVGGSSGTSTGPGQQGPSFMTGALGGAAAGSTFGPWGAAIGGALGGISTQL